MAIFGKSKKSKAAATTYPSQPPPQSQSAPAFYQQPNPSGLNAIPPQPQWTYIEQRPQTSAGHSNPAPQGWLVAPVPQHYQPIFFTQNVQVPPPKPPRLQKSSGPISKLKLSSMSDLLAHDVPECIPGARIFNDGIPPLQMQATQYLNQGAALCDLITSKFNEIITLIDGERFSGNEGELVVHQPHPQPMWQQEQPRNANKEIVKGKSKGMVNNSISSALTSTNYFAKVNLYANSRLPPNLPPLKL